MTIDNHVHERIKQRLQGVVSDPLALLQRAIDYVSRKPNRNLAMLVARLGKAYGDTRGSIYDRQSNGDEVWIVARQGELRTIMFRRSTQPKKLDSFNVDEIVDLVNVPLPSNLDSIDRLIKNLKSSVVR